MKSFLQLGFLLTIFWVNVSAECDGTGENPSCEKNSEAEVVLRYIKKVEKCVKFSGLGSEEKKAMKACEKDTFGQKSFDCFILCLWNKVGAMSEKNVDGQTYLVEDFNAYSRQMAKAFPERRTVDAAISIMSRCKSLLADDPFYPTLEKCDRLNGFYRCATYNFMKYHDCEITQEDKQFLGVLDLEILEQRRRK